jgi:uncharacterized LabA/DUF88 family protein
MARPSAFKHFHPDERFAVFIDGANLYQTAKALGYDVDYRRLLEVFASSGRLLRAYYYTALLDEQEYSPIRPLVDWLDYNGYTMVTKPLKEFGQGAGRRLHEDGASREAMNVATRVKVYRPMGLPQKASSR